MRVVARIPSHDTASYRAFEKAVLHEFAQHRASKEGGTELLRLNSHEAEKCKAFLLSVTSKSSCP